MAGRGDVWSVGALGKELRRLLAEAAERGNSSAYYSPFRAIERVKRIDRLAGWIKMRGGSIAAEGLTMSGLEVLEAQVRLLGEQVAIAMQLVRDLKGEAGLALQPAAAPPLRVVRSGDPIRDVRVEAAKYVAMGKSWDQFVDLIDPELMRQAMGMYAEFGPGRRLGSGRSVIGFREHIMAGVPTVDKAVAPPPSDQRVA